MPNISQALNSDCVSRAIAYHVRGGIQLTGEISVSGSKNAALPLIASSILTHGITTFSNVPRIRDVDAMLGILRFLGAEIVLDRDRLQIQTGRIENRFIPAEYTAALRGSILLLGPLLARFGVAEMAYPAGCSVGERSITTHLDVFEQMGIENRSTGEVLKLEGRLKSGCVVLSEFSVTATENAILAAASLPGTTRIELAATEPHVQDVLRYIRHLGARVDGIGTHTLSVHGSDRLHGSHHTVVSDYLEAGTFAVAAAVTRGKMRIRNVCRSQLLAFLDTLRRLGVVCYWDEPSVLVEDAKDSLLKAVAVRTNIFPGFPTDLQPPLAVALTQATGVSRICERLFEDRFACLNQLNAMGAIAKVLNPHEAIITGPTRLRGQTLVSNDIRAGAAMVLAALCAEGDSIVTQAERIERGYEEFVEKLQLLGANIARLPVAHSTT